jgi:hypothetical protein
MSSLFIGGPARDPFAGFSDLVRGRRPAALDDRADDAAQIAAAQRGERPRAEHRQQLAPDRGLDLAATGQACAFELDVPRCDRVEGAGGIAGRDPDPLGLLVPVRRGITLAPFPEVDVDPLAQGGDRLARLLTRLCEGELADPPESDPARRCRAGQPLHHDVGLVTARPHADPETGDLGVALDVVAGGIRLQQSDFELGQIGRRVP